MDLALRLEQLDEQLDEQSRAELLVSEYEKGAVMIDSHQHLVDTVKRSRKTWREVLRGSAPLLLFVSAVSAAALDSGERSDP